MDRFRRVGSAFPERLRAACTGEVRLRDFGQGRQGAGETVPRQGHGAIAGSVDAAGSSAHARTRRVQDRHGGTPTRPFTKATLTDVRANPLGKHFGML